MLGRRSGKVTHVAGRDRCDVRRLTAYGFARTAGTRDGTSRAAPITTHISYVMSPPKIVSERGAVVDKKTKNTGRRRAATIWCCLHRSRSSSSSSSSSGTATTALHSVLCKEVCRLCVFSRTTSILCVPVYKRCPIAVPTFADNLTHAGPDDFHGYVLAGCPSKVKLAVHVVPESRRHGPLCTRRTQGRVGRGRRGGVLMCCFPQSFDH